MRRAWRTSTWAASATALRARSSSPTCPAAGRQLLGGGDDRPPRRASPTCLERDLTSARSSSRRPMARRRRLVQLDQMVDLGRSHSPSAEGGFHRPTVVSHHADIDHDDDNGSVTPRGRPDHSGSSPAMSPGQSLGRLTGRPPAGSPGDAAGSPAEPTGGSSADAASAVVCEDIVIRYGDTLAVDRLSFVGHAGQVVALLGPNGAGKTSTVEALEGYRKIESGSVRVLGLDPGRDHAALVPRIGVMLQRGGVYPMLGSAQVLHLFSRYYDDPEDPDMLIELVGLGAVRRTPWRRLSGGEQQRLVPRSGPGREARGALPRRAHSRRRPRGPPRRPLDHRRPARPGHLRDPHHP